MLRLAGYRFFFSREGHKPPHIHVERGGRYAKFWPDPVSLARSRGFRMHELTEIQRIVEEKRQLFEEKYRDYFSR